MSAFGFDEGEGERGRGRKVRREEGLYTHSRTGVVCRASGC